jgi:hypothetical protein
MSRAMVTLVIAWKGRGEQRKEDIYRAVCRSSAEGKWSFSMSAVLCGS